MIPVQTRRPQSPGEEVANSLIHGVALLGSIVALPVLILFSAGLDDTRELVGVSIFGATLILLYASSSLYHAMPASKAKDVFRIIDHGAIYLLIAGSYTPFALGALRGPVGWTVLVVVWTLALLGVLAKVLFRFRYPRLSTWLYLGMGWMVMAVLKPMITHVPAAGLLWLLAGGLCYTGGVVFYATDARIRYGHAIWHVFVAAGSACHFFAVLRYAATRVG